MATVFYLNNDAAAEPKPDVTSHGHSLATLHNLNTGDKLMTLTRGSTNRSLGASITEPGVSPHYGFVGMWISQPLAANTNFVTTDTFTFAGTVATGGPSHNMYVHALIYVWKGDDTGIRGTLFDNQSTLDLSDAALGTQRLFFDGIAFTAAVNALAGDRIVLEYHWADLNTKTVPYDHYHGYDGAADSGYDSYLSISRDFSVVAGATYAQVCPQGITVNERLRKTLAKKQTQGISVVDKSVGKGWTYHLTQGITVSDKLKKYFRKLARRE